LLLSSAEKYCCLNFLLESEMTRKKMEIASHKLDPAKFAAPYYPLTLDKNSANFAFRARAHALAEVEGLRLITLPTPDVGREIEVLIPDAKRCDAIAAELKADLKTPLTTIVMNSGGHLVRIYESIRGNGSGSGALFSIYKFLNDAVCYCLGLGTKSPITPTEAIAALHFIGDRFEQGLCVSHVIQTSLLDNDRNQGALAAVSRDIDDGAERLCQRMRKLHIALGDKEVVLPADAPATETTEKTEDSKEEKKQ
jgi:hypothetical protein